MGLLMFTNVWSQTEQVVIIRQSVHEINACQTTRYHQIKHYELKYRHQVVAHRQQIQVLHLQVLVLHLQVHQLQVQIHHR